MTRAHPSTIVLADSGAEVAKFLAQFSTVNRAEALHMALRALRARVEPERVLACELAWEVHQRGYWSTLHRPDGSPYDSEETYFRDVLGLASWRTAYKRLAIGRMLMSFAEAERSGLRHALAEVGLAKATIVAPAIERLGQWRVWLGQAAELSSIALQQRVSEALHALPRGRELSPPGTRFRRLVLAAMPDIEAMELVERFFEVGETVVRTENSIGIFLAGCRECLPEWEVQATRRLLEATRRTVRPRADDLTSQTPVLRFAHMGKSVGRHAEAQVTWARTTRSENLSRARRGAARRRRRSGRRSANRSCDARSFAVKAVARADGSIFITWSSAPRAGRTSIATDSSRCADAAICGRTRRTVAGGSSSRLAGWDLPVRGGLADIEMGPASPLTGTAAPSP